MGKGEFKKKHDLVPSVSTPRYSIVFSRTKHTKPVFTLKCHCVRYQKTNATTMSLKQ